MTEENADRASARIAESRAWLLLARLFDHPDSALLEALGNGRLRDSVLEVFTTIDPVSTAWCDRSTFVDSTDRASLSAEYVRLFCFGERDMPLCSLHEGEHRGHRMQVMEEVLRFYRHFDLSIAQSPNEMPDHLVSELEFLHFLSFQSARYIRHGRDDSAFRRASADFLARHAGRWMQRFGNLLAAMDTLPFYRDSGRLLADFVGRSVGPELPVFQH